MRVLSENIRLGPQSFPKTPFDAIRYFDMDKKSWAFDKTVPMKGSFGADFTPYETTLSTPLEVINTTALGDVGGTLTRNISSEQEKLETFKRILEDYYEEFSKADLPSHRGTKYVTDEFFEKALDFLPDKFDPAYKVAYDSMRPRNDDKFLFLNTLLDPENYDSFNKENLLNAFKELRSSQNLPFSQRVEAVNNTISKYPANDLQALRELVLGLDNRFFIHSDSVPLRGYDAERNEARRYAVEVFKNKLNKSGDIDPYSFESPHYTSKTPVEFSYPERKNIAEQYKQQRAQLESADDAAMGMTLETPVQWHRYSPPQESPVPVKSNIEQSQDLVDMIEMEEMLKHTTPVNMNINSYINQLEEGIINADQLGTGLQKVFNESPDALISHFMYQGGTNEVLNQVEQVTSIPKDLILSAKAAGLDSTDLITLKNEAANEGLHIIDYIEQFYPEVAKQVGTANEWLGKLGKPETISLKQWLLGNK